jgi:acyl carrier protein
MVPSAFVFMEGLPITPNGKVNRQALPAPSARPDLDQTYVPPQTELEQMIARVWQRVLPVEHVGLHDNFFDLGGHSLSMVQAHSQLQETFGDKLALLDLFQYPTIHTLANHLAQDAERLNPALLIGRDVARARREALRQRADVQDQRRTYRRGGGRDG